MCWKLKKKNIVNTQRAIEIDPSTANIKLSNEVSAPQKLANGMKVVTDTGKVSGTQKPETKTDVAEVQDTEEVTTQTEKAKTESKWFKKPFTHVEGEKYKESEVISISKVGKYILKSYKGLNTRVVIDPEDGKEYSFSNIDPKYYGLRLNEVINKLTGKNDADEPEDLAVRKGYRPSNNVNGGGYMVGIVGSYVVQKSYGTSPVKFEVPTGYGDIIQFTSEDLEASGMTLEEYLESDAFKNKIS